MISDTHSYLDDPVKRHLERCDEIWHAGDFGYIDIADQLAAIKPLTGVYGNIDGPDVKKYYNEVAAFNCENVKVLMIHIGGYPGKYSPLANLHLTSFAPQLFISGHSHILKIMYDSKINCLHINPGAAGKQGWHTKRTIVRFTIDDTNIKDCEVIELGTR